jgi:hypothetical protein
LGSRADGLQHMLQAADSGHVEAAYMFGILTVEYNNSVVEVEEALIHMDKFSTLSLANPTIRWWIRSVRYDAILMLIRYENLGWGSRFFHQVQDLPQCHTPGCQAPIYRNAWKSERWMTSCSCICWWRQKHKMFVATFKSPYFGRNDWKPHGRELDEEWC